MQIIHYENIRLKIYQTFILSILKNRVFNAFEAALDLLGSFLKATCFLAFPPNIV